MRFVHKIQHHMKWAVLALPLMVAPKLVVTEETVEAPVLPLEVVIEDSIDVPKFNRLEDLVFASMPEMDMKVAGDERCLAQAIYFEARSENLEGQLAVAQVVLNRVDDRRYPPSICGVVFQNDHLPFRCQFSFACDGRSDNPHNKQAWAIARTIANIALNGHWMDLSDASTHYHTVEVTPYWMSKLDRRVKVGRHIFYRDSSF